MSHHHHYKNQSAKNIKIAFWLNTSFALIEIVGGLMINSVAVRSDAVHDLGDSLSLGAAWFFQKKSTSQKTSDFSYGYRRFSLIGALINAVVLCTGSAIILFESFQRFFNPETSNAKGMLVLALLGIAVNYTAMKRLQKGSGLNEKIVSLHFLEDVLGWLAVLIGAVLMMFVNAPFIDPALSLAISAYVLFNVYQNLKPVFRILLQAVPTDVSEEQIRRKLFEIPGLRSLHDIHIWSMDGYLNIMTLHVRLTADAEKTEQHKIKDMIRKSLIELNIHHITIEIENSATDPDAINCPLD